MLKTWENTQTGRDYAMAHAVHHADHDLRKALQLYLTLIASHPDSDEAKYSRMQIQNIVREVVPEKVLADAQVDLALAIL